VFAVGLGTVPAPINPASAAWICASLTEVPSAGSVIVAVPMWLPWPIVWPPTLYSPSWSISWLVSTKSKKPFSWAASGVPSPPCHHAPQNTVKTWTAVSNGPPR